MVSRIVLLYATLGSSNRGCDALTISIINLIKKFSPESSIIAYCTSAQPGEELDYLGYKELILKIMPKKRFRALNEFVNDLINSDIVIDLSSGDGFSDIYSFTSMRNHVFNKGLAIKFSKKYVLAPQTIGPFNNFLSKLGGKIYSKKSESDFFKRYIVIILCQFN